MSIGENIKGNRNTLSWDKRRRSLLQDIFTAIDREERKKKIQIKQKGLRTIFIETYLKYGYNKAKETINSSFYNDEIFASWIGEDVLGYNPNTKILDAYNENSDKEHAYAVANKINSEIGVEVYTQALVDDLIDRDRRRKEIRDDDAR